MNRSTDGPHANSPDHNNDMSPEVKSTIQQNEDYRRQVAEDEERELMSVVQSEQTESTKPQEEPKLFEDDGTYRTVTGDDETGTNMNMVDEKESNHRNHESENEVDADDSASKEASPLLAYNPPDGSHLPFKPIKPRKTPSPELKELHLQKCMRLRHVEGDTLVETVEVFTKSDAVSPDGVLHHMNCILTHQSRILRVGDWFPESGIFLCMSSQLIGTSQYLYVNFKVPHGEGKASSYLTVTFARMLKSRMPTEKVNPESKEYKGFVQDLLAIANDYHERISANPGHPYLKRTVPSSDISPQSENSSQKFGPRAYATT